MLTNYFEGWYFKHQKDNNTIAFIPGVCNSKAFVQVITNYKSYNFSYELSEFAVSKEVQVGNSVFSKNSIKIDLQDKGINISGDIKYSDLTPIKYDIMGPFKYIPMECRHGVISMRHDLEGSIYINGEKADYTNGIGYIEKDSGSSFPKTYLWVQCNDFKEKCSIILSIADIPFLGTTFKGCICVVYYNRKEYRLATYLGAKIEQYDEKDIVLKQGKYRLEIEVFNAYGQKLYAPEMGVMSRIIHESPACKARFKFFIYNKLMFDIESDNASFEYVR